MTRAIFSALLLCCLTARQDAAKILGIFPFPGPSQYILVEPYLKELASRGHELTVINAFPQKKPVKNFRDISVAEIRKMNDDIIDDVLIEKTKWNELNFLCEYGNMVTLNVLENSEVQQLIKSKQHFDVIIIETLVNDALYGFAEHFGGAHLIGISSFGTIPMIDDHVGNTSPISYIPNLTLGLTDRMSYMERLQNLLVSAIEMLHLHLIHLPEQQALHRKYFPHSQLNLLEVRKNFTLMLLNQHFSLSFPRPYVPNMIEVGGLHLKRKPGVLPEDMQQFLNASGDAGVIYFSMGSNIKSKDLPKEKLEIIMRTFASLKQSVMWKFEQPDLPGKPDNVFISKWFPQPDILAHPSVKLFITHGGLLSTIESLYHGKPVLGIPMFYDQFLNVERAKKAGYGLSIDFKQLNEHEFRSKIVELLEQPSYMQVVQRLMRRYRDQPMAPMDTAIYWTEYVLRHNGAPHMRVAAQELNFVQYHSLDTLLVLFGGVVLVLVSILALVVKLLHVICCRKKQSTQKQKRN